jgi:hypothetical protein
VLFGTLSEEDLQNDSSDEEILGSRYPPPIWAVSPSVLPTNDESIMIDIKEKKMINLSGLMIFIPFDDTLCVIR